MNGAEHGKGNAQPGPFRAEAVLDVIHRAADIVAFFVALAEFHGADGFGVFGGHADQRGHPHPEQRPGAAEEHSGGNAGDVAGADGGRQRGHQGVERADLPLAPAFAALEQQAEASANAQDRHEFQPDLQEKADAQDQDQHQRPPDDPLCPGGQRLLAGLFQGGKIFIRVE